MRALIVEDDASSRRAMVHLLKSMGFEVAWVRSVCEARWVLVTSPPQVMIVDLLLPDGNGIEVLQFVRQHDLSVSAAVVSGADDLMLVEVIKLRPETVFQKPVDVDALRGWLSGVLERVSEHGRSC